jgi:RNA-directed DNA polymerase
MHYNGRAMHPGWVLDADITKCFDTIDHDALLAKLKGSPFQNMIRRWLKCGAIDKVGFERTEKGTP